MTLTKMMTITLASAVLLTGFSGDADAWGGRGKGMRGKGMRGGGGRGGKLLRVPPQRLKALLNLTDAQVQRIQQIRYNFMTKRIQLRAAAAQKQLLLRQQLQKDIPNQAAVLKLMRQKRAVRGKMQEERVKAHLKALNVLTKQQRELARTKLRAMRGKHHRFGKGRFGKGRFGKGCGGKGRGGRMGSRMGPGPL